MGRAIAPDDILAAAIVAERSASTTVATPANRCSRVLDAIKTGMVYPLCNADGRGAAAILYVARDARLAVVVCLHLGEEPREEPLKLAFHGLDPILRYTARMSCGGPLPTGLPARAPGSYYMARRFRLPLNGTVRGAALLLDAGSDEKPKRAC